MDFKGDYKIWQELNEKTAPKEIFSGTGASVHDLYNEYSPEIKLIVETGTILDFACGVGRNSVELCKQFDKVLCYDFPNMISMFASTDAYKKNASKIGLFTDWDVVKTRKVSTILCCLALQHINSLDLDVYLKDFKSMSRNLYVLSRSYNDWEGMSVYEIVTKHWKASNTYSKTEEEIRKATGEAHYFIKLTW